MAAASGGFAMKLALEKSRYKWTSHEKLMGNASLTYPTVGQCGVAIQGSCIASVVRPAQTFWPFPRVKNYVLEPAH
jgi:hypothetical protein